MILLKIVLFFSVLRGLFVSPFFSQQNTEWYEIQAYEIGKAGRIELNDDVSIVEIWKSNGIDYMTLQTVQGSFLLTNPNFPENSVLQLTIVIISKNKIQGKNGMEYTVYKTIDEEGTIAMITISSKEISIFISYVPEIILFIKDKYKKT